MSFDPKQPYNDLPLLPPRCELETKPVLKRCVAANKALAELKSAGDLIPNQAVLINAGLLRIPVLYLSRYLILHKAEYYRLLRASLGATNGRRACSTSSLAWKRRPTGPPAESSPSATSSTRRSALLKVLTA